MKIAVTTLTLTLMGALSLGCGQKVAFSESPADESGSLVVTDPPPVCLPGQDGVNKTTKVVFVVDQSGSNVDGPAEDPGNATDGDKSLRTGAIREFLRLHGAKKHIAWGMIGFKSQGAYALTRGSRSSDPVFGDANLMQSALRSFEVTEDYGSTPYLAALRMAMELVARDRMSGADADTQYRIAFITDGYPTDLVLRLEESIDESVQEIVQLGSSKQIRLSTVYYGQPDARAAARLRRMAAEGKGEFLDVGNSKRLHLDDVIEVPKPTCN